MARTQQVLQTARFMGDTSSITDAIGAPANVKRRLFTRGVGFTVGRLQMRLGIFGLAGMALLLNWLDDLIKQARRESLYVGTAVKYGKHLNDGTAHMPATHWWDDGVRRAKRALNNRDLSGIFGTIATVPSVSGGINRTTLYEGQEFYNDVLAAATGSIAGRLATRMAGAASARLFFGTLLEENNNPAMIPALMYQKKLMESIDEKDLVDTGCLLNSIAIGKSKSAVKAKSAKGCFAASGKSPSVIGDTQNIIEV